MARIRSKKLLGALVLACVWRTPSLAAEPAPSLPNQPAWSVNVEPDQCTLSHPVDNEGLSALAIQSWAGEDAYQVLVEAKSFPFSTASELFQTSVIFQPDRPTMHQLARVSRLQGNDDKLLILSGVNHGIIDALAHSSEIIIAKGSKQIGPISLPNAPRAMAAFQKCLNDQLIAWGADPSQFDPGGELPVALIDRDNFIPNQTLLKIVFDGGNLEARFKVGIGLDGSINSCERIDTKSSDNVEEIICGAVMAKKLFSPAKGPAGLAVNGIATFRVTLLKRPS